MALPTGGVMVWDIARHRSIVKVLDNPAGGWGCAFVVGGGLLALVGIAGWLGHQEGIWRLLPLVAINVAVQPVCALMVASGCYQTIMGFAGRVTFRFRTVPPADGEDLTRYQQFART